MTKLTKVDLNLVRSDQLVQIIVAVKIWSRGWGKTTCNCCGLGARGWEANFLPGEVIKFTTLAVFCKCFGRRRDETGLEACCFDMRVFRGGEGWMCVCVLKAVLSAKGGSTCEGGFPLWHLGEGSIAQ